MVGDSLICLGCPRNLVSSVLTHCLADIHLLSQVSIIIFPYDLVGVNTLLLKFHEIMLKFSKT